MLAKGTPGRLEAVQPEALLETLRIRFERNMARHEGILWAKVQAKLESAPEKLRSLGEMKRTGGEPDVVGHDWTGNEYLFVDFWKESPKGRRSVSYDRRALESRKKHKPGNSAVQMATDMGAELVTEGQYRRLQELGEFDTKTIRRRPVTRNPHARQTMENIKEVLERNGSSMDRVVKCLVMIDDMAEWPAMNEVYGPYFPDHKPARSAIGADGLALGAKVEIECWATVG